MGQQNLRLAHKEMKEGRQHEEEEEWQSGSLSQENLHIYAQDQEQTPLQEELTIKKKPHKHVNMGLCRKNQGFSLFGHCLLLITFIFSLILIMLLMYWMDLLLP